jgi:hypothetical protein
MKLKEKYQLLGLEVNNFTKEQEGREYEACQFEVNGIKYLGRTAKVTPNKNGLFVTLWKRNSNGVTAPFNEHDSIDYAIILVTEKEKSGYFKFPKETLLQKGILSTTKREGKRGFRAYPPWSLTTSRQAEKTQQWQRQYFIKKTNLSSKF